VDVPSTLAEQKAIGHILGTLDDKIELNRQLNETLESMARTLFRSWFVDFDPVHLKEDGQDTGFSKSITNLFPNSFEGSDLGEIPKGWTIGTLGDIAASQHRAVLPNEIDGETPYIGLEHMPRGRIALTDWGCSETIESGKLAFKRGEILFGKLRPYFHKVGVAPLDGVCSTDIVVLAPCSEEWFGLTLEQVSSVAFVDYTNAGSTGTKMPRTSWNEMARYKMVTPPDQVARAFNSQVRPLVDRIIASVQETRTLASIRDTLLPKLISGELRVKDAKHFNQERTL